MSDYTPVNSDTGPFTLTAAVAIAGGQLVEGTADGTCSPSGGSKRAIGVAEHDAGAGQRVAIYPIQGYQHEVLIKNGTALAAGGPCVAAANGQLDLGTNLATAAAAGTLIGVVTKGGTGDGTTVKARFVGV